MVCVCVFGSTAASSLVVFSSSLAICERDGKRPYSPSIRRNICCADSVDPFWPESKSSVHTMIPLNGNIKMKTMARLKLFTFILEFGILLLVIYVVFYSHAQTARQPDRFTPSCSPLRSLCYLSVQIICKLWRRRRRKKNCTPNPRFYSLITALCSKFVCFSIVDRCSTWLLSMINVVNVHLLTFIQFGFPRPNNSDKIQNNFQSKTGQRNTKLHRFYP